MELNKVNIQIFKYLKRKLKDKLGKSNVIYDTLQQEAISTAGFTLPSVFFRGVSINPVMVHTDGSIHFYNASIPISIYGETSAECYSLSTDIEYFVRDYEFYSEVKFFVRNIVVDSIDETEIEGKPVFVLNMTIEGVLNAKELR